MYDIKKRRTELGLTLQQIGNEVGVGASTVRKWEQGMIKNMKRDKISLLAKVLQINPLQLTENENIEYKPNTENNEIEEKITETVKELKEERKIKVLNFAKSELEEQNYIKEDTVIYSFVNMYGSISAGTGNYIEDTPVEQVRVEGIPPQHDIALKVSGDSMLPLFENGEIVYIVKTSTIQNGQIGAFILDGEAYLKKLYSKNGKIRLVSLNKKYKDIEIDEYSELHVVGKVVI